MDKFAALVTRGFSTAVMQGRSHAAPVPVLSAFSRRTFASAESQPTNEQQATGAERRELEAGVDVWDNPELAGPFGTKENPVIVESIFEERVVGCPGECKEGVYEGLRWFIVKSGAPYVCPDCGQYFQLKKLSTAEGSH